jgi:hypothetical protein
LSEDFFEFSVSSLFWIHRRAFPHTAEAFDFKADLPPRRKIEKLLASVLSNGSGRRRQ